MNVKQLIEILSRYPDNKRIMVEGYEAGCSDVSKVSNTGILINHNTTSVYGKHEPCNDNPDEEALLLLGDPDNRRISNLEEGVDKTFDNLATMRREFWHNGILASWITAKMINAENSCWEKFGTYPNLQGETKS